MIRVLELFAGIGAWKKALDNLNIANETIPIEIDKTTMNSYNLIHNSNHKTCDIKDFVANDNYDLIVMSPPCQNYSKAKQCSKRETDNLIAFTLPIIKKCNPRYVIIENVPPFQYSCDYANFWCKMTNLGYSEKVATNNEFFTP